MFNWHANCRSQWFSEQMGDFEKIGNIFEQEILPKILKTPSSKLPKTPKTPNSSKLPNLLNFNALALSPPQGWRIKILKCLVLWDENSKKLQFWKSMFDWHANCLSQWFAEKMGNFWKIGNIFEQKILPKILKTPSNKLSKTPKAPNIFNLPNLLNFDASALRVFRG